MVNVVSWFNRIFFFNRQTVRLLALLGQRLWYLITEMQSNWWWTSNTFGLYKLLMEIEKKKKFKQKHVMPNLYVIGTFPKRTINFEWDHLQLYSLWGLVFFFSNVWKKKCVEFVMHRFGSGRSGLDFICEMFTSIELNINVICRFEFRECDFFFVNFELVQAILYLNISIWSSNLAAFEEKLWHKSMPVVAFKGNPIQIPQHNNDILPHSGIKKKYVAAQHSVALCLHLERFLDGCVEFEECKWIWMRRFRVQRQLKKKSLQICCNSTTVAA